MRKWRPSGGVGCHFSPSWSNAKNKNNSPMLIPILFHEVIINKCIYHGFYFIHCIQFSQFNDLYIVRSQGFMQDENVACHDIGKLSFERAVGCFGTPQLERAARFPMPQLERVTCFAMPQLERATRFPNVPSRVATRFRMFQFEHE